MQQIQLRDEESGVVLAASVLPEFEDDQPRVRDLDLGEWLGYERPRAVRELIKDNLPEIEALGVCRAVRQTSGPLGGRPGEEFWLTEEQAIAVCQLSQTPRASSVRTMLRRMFVEYRKGSLTPATTNAVVQLAPVDVMLDAIAHLAVTVDNLGAAVDRGYTGLREEQVRTNGRVDEVIHRLGAVEAAVNRTRKDPRPADVEVMTTVVASYYQGRCPCCHQTQILDGAGTRTGAWVVDHTNSAFDNKLRSLWPVCRACNQLLYSRAGFRAETRSEFAVFQKCVGLVLPQQLRLLM